MAGVVRGYLVKDQTQKGKGEIGRLCVNVAKVLPASATGNIFTVTGIVVVNALVGVVSTALSVTSTTVSVGVTGSNSAIAAASAGLASTTVGSVFIMPTSLGAALPTPITTSQAVTASNVFIVNAGAITLTTSATNTGAVTWMLSWEPLYPKGVGSVAAV